MAIHYNRLNKWGKLFGFLVMLFLSIKGYSQDGYNIELTLTPWKNDKVYLGYYYGNRKALADSAMLNESSHAIFSGENPLPGGIYFVVSSRMEILFELLIDKDQHFSIVADTATMFSGVIFKDSEENKDFQEYAKFSSSIGREINNIQKRIESTQNETEKDMLRAVANSLNDRLVQYRDSTVKANPDAFLSLLFKGMTEPKVPPAEEHPGGRYDTLYAFNYFKSHYWDGIAFDDARLIRTPFFEARLNKYFDELVSPEPDSIIPEIDYMLLYARTQPEMFQFLTVFFVQKYVNPKYMGQDAVFVHLFEKYINTGMTPFFTDSYREFLDRRAFSLMANLIGKPAPNLEMITADGRKLPLYNVNSDFTVVLFWDPTCGHCKELLPRLDSIYNAKWKNEGVAVYAVKVGGPEDEWKKMISSHNIQHWIHVYPSEGYEEKEIAAGRPGYRQLYDVYMTPIMYLLDKDKRIIAKKLTYLQMDDIINMKKKNP